MDAGPVDAVGISNQRASTVVWDRATGEPVGPGIGWQDLRTVGTCLQLRAEGIRDLLRKLDVPHDIDTLRTELAATGSETKIKKIAKRLKVLEAFNKSPFPLSPAPRFNERIIALNLLGPMYVSQEANRVMQAQDGGGLDSTWLAVVGPDDGDGTLERLAGAVLFQIEDQTALVAIASEIQRRHPRVMRGAESVLRAPKPSRLLSLCATTSG